jgi:hypothetical protein
MSEQTPEPPPDGTPPAAPSYPPPHQQPPPPPYGQAYPQQYPQPYPQQPGYYPYSHGYPQPPGYATPPYGGYPQPSPTPGSSIALVVVSGILTLGCLFGIPSLVIGIVALTKVNTNIAETRRLTRIGWITLAIIGTIAIVGLVVLIAVAISHDNNNPDFTFDTLGRTGTRTPAAVLRST